MNALAQITNFSGTMSNVVYRYNRPSDLVTFSGAAAIFRVFQFTNSVSGNVSAREILDIIDSDFTNFPFRAYRATRP